MAEPTPENAADGTPVAESATADAPAAETASADVADAQPTDQATAAAPGPEDEAAAGETDAGAEPLDDLVTGEPSSTSTLPTVPEIDLSQLPLHTRSLLKIEVPVRVTLAHQRRPIHEITELGPGTLVKFEKTYDEPMELSVGDLPIALGEVVKVGDKFGLRISKIIRPHERFESVGK